MIPSLRVDLESMMETYRQEEWTALQGVHPIWTSIRDGQIRFMFSLISRLAVDDINNLFGGIKWVRHAFLIQCLPNTALTCASQCWYLEASPQTESLLRLPISFMQSINRFLYGPTPEDRVREWQAKLRRESRVLDREMRQVRLLTATVWDSGIDSSL